MEKSLTYKKYPKVYIDKNMQTIQALNKSQSVHVSLPDHPDQNQKGSWESTTKNFLLKCDSQVLSLFDNPMDLGKVDSELQVEFPISSLTIDGAFLSKRGFQIDSQGLVPTAIHKSQFEIYSAHTAGFNCSNMHSFQLLIPTMKKLSMSFLIEDIVFETDTGLTSRGALAVNVENDDFLLFTTTSDSNQQFLGIQSDQPMTLEYFSTKVYSIISCLGYITGHLIGNKGYYFAADCAAPTNYEDLVYKSLRPSLRSITVPIYSNPAGYSQLGFSSSERNQIHKSLLSSEQFSKLCTMHCRVPDFQSVLTLIMEANSASLIFRPGGYAIALETMANMLKPKSVKNKAPVHPSIWVSLKQKLVKVINDSCIDSEAKQILTGKISDLNKPTNASRLLLPFELLNIELSNEEKKILKARNAILHGRVPAQIKAKSSTGERNVNQNLHYTSCRLYDLLALLIFKKIGYNGFILNHVKIDESNFDISINESFYRQV